MMLMMPMRLDSLLNISSASPQPHISVSRISRRSDSISLRSLLLRSAIGSSSWDCVDGPITSIAGRALRSCLQQGHLTDQLHVGHERVGMSVLFGFGCRHEL